MRCIDMRHFETQSVYFRQYSSSFTIVSFVFNCWHKVARLWLERRLLDDNQWHVKRSLSMYKEHSISAAYRPLYHFHIGSRPPYNRTLIMAPCKPLTMMVLVQCWIWWSLLSGWTLLWYYETRLLGGRPETSLCFYLLVWPQIKHLQRHQTCVEAKETRTKGSDVFTSVHRTAADITSHRENEDAWGTLSLEM